MIKNRKKVFEYRVLPPSPEKEIVVSQTPAQEPLLNDAGWPANDITLLMKLQQSDPSNPLIPSLEAGLVDIGAKPADNSSKSDSELASETLPRFVHRLADMLRWVKSQPLSVREREMLEEQFVDDSNDEKSEKTDDSKETATSE